MTHPDTFSFSSISLSKFEKGCENFCHFRPIFHILLLKQRKISFWHTFCEIRLGLGCLKHALNYYKKAIISLNRTRNLFKITIFYSIVFSYKGSSRCVIITKRTACNCSFPFPFPFRFYSTSTFKYKNANDKS